MNRAASGLSPWRRPLRSAAVLLNLLLFGIGLYFEVHPRDRGDVWSAGGVAAVAVLNSAALTLPALAGAGSRFLRRLHRIALLANTLLLVAGLAMVVLAALGDGRHAAIHGAALLVPPLVTLAALWRPVRG